MVFRMQSRAADFRSRSVAALQASVDASQPADSSFSRFNQVLYYRHIA